MRRALPSIPRRMIGPFVFLDEMGPVRLAPGGGLDVRPHPHIGLATLTYLFEGEILHQDSLGVRQPIRPGDVNWMIAGRGIAHSERTPQPLRAQGPPVGPSRGSRCRSTKKSACRLSPPPGAELPQTSIGGAALRLFAGRCRAALAGETLSAMFYAEARLDEGAELALAPEHEERGAYVVDGDLGGRAGVCARAAARLPARGTRGARGAGTARLMLLGGQTLGPRHMWWNFVSSSRERIEQAKQDWKGRPIRRCARRPGIHPLPEERKPAVDYP